MGSEFQTAAVAELDRRILNDPGIDTQLFERLVASQRELGLLHGDRPICPFLRPHILGREQYECISRAAETIAGAFEKLATHALSDDKILSELGLTANELRMVRIDPGYSAICVTSRLDAYLSESGFQFLEYNAEDPAGIGDQMQLLKLICLLDQNKEFLETYAHWRPEPHRLLLKSLIATYREWGGEEDRPRIAIVDWKGVPTESEFLILRQYFEAEGHPTMIVDPRELQYDGDRLRARESAVDILYKRVIIHELLDRMESTDALVRAYADGRVCMVNSFRCKLAHKKAGFAILSDPRYENLFTTREIEAARKHIPWTRRVQPSTTVFEESEHDLLNLIRRERHRFVMKPNDDYGGRGIFIGWEMDEAAWSGAIDLALTGSYVVQERAPATKVSIPMFSDRVRSEEMFIDFNPFLFHNKVEGAMVRLSSSSLLNITTGGGEAALLILENMQ
ncbi:MAG: hypothetical protein ACRD9S_21915 [Pyrinomonadaceae bacterium]